MKGAQYYCDEIEVEVDFERNPDGEDGGDDDRDMRDLPPSPADTA